MIFPVSGDRTTGKPEFRWKAGEGGLDARLQICADALCSTVLDTITGAGTAQPTTMLLRTGYFVRAFGRQPRGDGTFIEGITPTTTRVFFSTGRPSVSRAPVGLTPDIDRDALADIGVSNSTSNTSRISVALSAAKKTSVVNGPNEQPSGFAYGAFARAMILASDTDGDGFPEIATIDHATGAPNPTTVIRFGYDPATKKLIERQRIDVPIPAGQRFLQLTPLGDIDGDGFADIGVVRALPSVAGSGSGGGTIFYQTGVELETLFGGATGWSRVAKTQFLLTPQERSFENTPMPVRGVGDVDGDGVPDLALGIQTTNTDSCYPARRGRVEIRRGSASGGFEVVLATVADYFDPTPLGDVDGDGLADVGVTREPHETREPIGQNTTCDGSYKSTGFVPGEVRVLRGAAAAPLPQIAFTMPVDVVAGCKTGFAFGPNYLVNGVLAGAGDLDGDSLDDVAFVAPESHPGGTSGCNDAGPRIHVLQGTTAATLPVAQVLATPEAGFGPFPNRVRIIGDVDTGGRSALAVVGTLKMPIYEGPAGSLSLLKTISLANFGQLPLGGF